MSDIEFRRSVLTAERDRVTRLVSMAVEEIERDCGDIGVFSGFLIRAALEIPMELFGTEGIETMLSGIATRQLMAKLGVERKS